MARIVLFNKPFRVLSQFRESGDKATLSAYFDDPALRVAGRLDYDSEGLLVLTDDGKLRWTNDDDTVSSQPSRGFLQNVMNQVFKVVPKEQF